MKNLKIEEHKCKLNFCLWVYPHSTPASVELNYFDVVERKRSKNYKINEC